MSDRIALSVIVPCYNAESTIGATLDALAEQQWDKPWEVVESYKTKRIAKGRSHSAALPEPVALHSRDSRHFIQPMRNSRVQKFFLVLES
jgi:hypothetical protein